MHQYSFILKVLVLLAVSLFFSCDIVDEYFNYVVVTVHATVQITFDENNDGFPESVLKNEAVELSLVKDGGERVEETGITDNNNAETSITGVFNLYKEQPIVFTAKPVNYPTLIKKETLSWETVDKWAEGDGKKEPRTYKWTTGFGIMVQKN